MYISTTSIMSSDDSASLSKMKTTNLPSSSSSTSITPASSAASKASSAPTPSFASKTTRPFFVKRKLVGVLFPPETLITDRTSCSVRSLLSVSHSTITATLLGKIPSTVTFSRLCPVKLRPWPRAIAASMLDLAKPSRLTLVMRSASRGLCAGSGPKSFDAVLSSAAKTERCLFFAASALPLSCLILDQRLWPEKREAEVVRVR
ncbi:hypothetical protein KC367_g45 [Hortaea werneckii]|nr:hypothetical protein KC367_g45 [Hortaea werneckii]